MATFSHVTKDGENPKSKPRVYFTCHPEDLSASLEQITKDIFKTHNCAVYYTQDMTEPFAAKDLDTELGQMNLFVVPVTARLLTEQSRSMTVDIPYAKRFDIPILPFMLEEGLDELYSRQENFGQLQYLSPCCTDLTAIRYEEKLKKHLDSVLISDALARRVRAAFDAYIFLSYRKKDRRYANELMRLIHKNPECRSIAIWYDEFLTPGESFVESIQKAMKKSKLFALLVTPSLLEEPDGSPNYVMAEEYPAARRAQLDIFPAEMEDTDPHALAAKFRDIPACVKTDDADIFRAALLRAVRQITRPSDDETPEHRFLLGLAYFDGIDMEVDRQRGLQLITAAAEAGLTEAAERLLHIYKDGKNDRQQVLYWSKRLADHYYDSSFSSDGTLKAPDSVTALFSHYTDDYWQDVITLFLLRADQQLDADGIGRLYALLLDSGLREYSLLLEVSGQMTVHREKAQLTVVERILRNAVDGTAPPYGPLFWYIPAYGLYEAAVKAAWLLQGNAKAAALVRDVCFIFGQYDRVGDITKAVDGEAVYRAALPELSGVRQALCQLFYTGSTDYTGGDDIYPRCFNVEEARSLAATGIGQDRFMPTLFRDELGLFAITETNEALSGLVVLPYDEEVESFLAGNIRFVRGLILLNTDNGYMDYLEFFRKNIRVLYIPENCTRYDPNFALHMPLELSLQLPETAKKDALPQSSHRYIRHGVRIPEHWQSLPKGFFKNCTGLTSVTFPQQLAAVQAGWSDEEDTATPEKEAGLLGDSCFQSCSHLSGRILLPENVSKIGARAFRDCRSLEEVIFPDRIESIGPEAFAGCTSLTGKLSFPNRVETVADSAFLSCKSLTEVFFPAGVDHIGSNAFEGCSALQTVTFAQGIRGIGPYAFSGTGLRQLNFPKQTGYLVEAHLPEYVHQLFKLHFMQYAFSRCCELESVCLPDDLEVIPEGCFEDCEKLQSIHWPAKLQTIESRAFSCCGLTGLEIPEHVQQIGDYAFSRNRSLTHVVLRNPGIKLGRQVFSGCDGLKEVLLPEVFRHTDLGLPPDCRVTWLPSEHSLSDSDQRLWLREQQIPEAACRDQTKLRQVVLTDAVVIGDYAFSGCTALERLTVPDTLTELGKEAFARCAALEQVPFLPQIETLAAGAFRDCLSLREVRLHNGLRQLEQQTFAGCKKLRCVTFPSRLEAIEAGALEDCVSLQLEESLPLVTQIGENAFAGCAAITALELPAVEVISGNAFWGCSALTSLRPGPDLHTLGASAFCNCTALQVLRLDRTKLTLIDRNTFLGCKALRLLSLPESITLIGDCAFLQCVSLEELVFCPETLTDIREAAFAGCKSLKQMDIRNAEQISAFAFHDCAALEEVRLSPKLRQIENGTFADCVSLKDISFGPELTGIGYRAFYNCASLRRVRIPLRVTEIGDEAFVGCGALELVEISRNFQEDIQRIFGQIDPQIIRFIDTSQAVHQYQEQLLPPEPPAETVRQLDCAGCLLCAAEPPRYGVLPADFPEEADTRETPPPTPDHTRQLRELLQLFRIDGQVIRVIRSDRVICYEAQLDPAVKPGKLHLLAEELALQLDVPSVRICIRSAEAHIIGIEIPHGGFYAAPLGWLLRSDAFRSDPSETAVALGTDLDGDPVIESIEEMSRLLIAGTDSTETTVCIHNILVSLLHKASPDKVKLLLLDTPQTLVQSYADIPHLILPVITGAAKAIAALQWVLAEVNRRFQAMSAAGIHSLGECNALLETRDGTRLPEILVVINELADLLQFSAEANELLCQIAPLAQSCGIHLIVATARPSVDAPSALLRAHFRTRIAFSLATALDSRRFLNAPGAEQLLGRGDMLYTTLASIPRRIQCCRISLQAVSAFVAGVKAFRPPVYRTDVIAQIDALTAQVSGNAAVQEEDPLLNDAVELFLDVGTASVSLLQRRLKLGFGRAARLVDRMEELGILGPFLGSKPREIRITKAQWETMKRAKKADDPVD